MLRNKEKTMALKHVGRTVKQKRRMIVAYRTIPGDAESCLCIPTDSLPADQHDALMQVVESNTGQTSNELAEALVRNRLPDGRNMLHAFHQTGKLNKYPTSEVEMTPDTKSTILLSELNKIIAEQKGVSIEDLAISGGEQQATPTASEPVVESTSIQEPATDGVITDEELAAKYRSDADRLFKEAKRLREQAEELVPTKKTRKKESDVA